MNVFGVQNHFRVPINGWREYCREKTVILRPLQFETLTAESLFPPPRSRHGSCVVRDKVVLIAGHKRVGTSFIRCNDIWMFDSVTETFEELRVYGETVPVMSRIWAGAIENTVYCFGGIKQDGKKLNDIFSLNLETQTWRTEETTGERPCKRCDPLGVVYGKKIIVVGGSDKNLHFPIDVYEYNTETRIWKLIPLMGDFPTNRIASCSSRIDNILYIYGGGVWDKEAREYNEHYSEIFALNLDTYVWSDLNYREFVPEIVNIFPVLFSVGNHLILDGGRYQRVGEIAETFIYDTIKGEWKDANIAPGTALSNNCATANYINGNAYLFGGNRGVASSAMIKVSLEHLQPFQNFNY